jgi:hypothetical protein
MTVHIHEHAALLVANERMADARRHAEERRANRLARGARLSARTRLGRILVRLGYRIMGESSAPPNRQDVSRHAASYPVIMTSQSQTARVSSSCVPL